MELCELTALKEEIQAVLGNIARFSYYSRIQQHFFASRINVRLCDQMGELAEKLVERQEELNGDVPVYDVQGLASTLLQIQCAQEARDYIFLTDLYELQLLPVLTGVQERIVSALGVFVDEELLRKNVRSCGERNPQLLYSLLPEEVVRECLAEGDALSDQCMEQLVDIVERCAEKGYVVELTSSGYSTLAIRSGESVQYVHTNGNVVSEAVCLAGEWLSQDKEAYVFYGMGFGYAYREMLYADFNISVEVWETNRELLTLALFFAPLWELYESGRFQLIYDPTGRRMGELALGLEERRGFYIFYPALSGVRQQGLRQKLTSFFVQESSVRTQRRFLMGNFRKNICVEAGNICQLEKVFAGREVIIAAAGPSLDKNIEILKKKGEGRIVLAVGTVLRKLLKAGIRPDYVIMTDANESSYPQIAGVEDCGVPLLFFSTVFSRVPASYRGEKYLLCQKGFAPAETLAGEEGWPLVESGGSVITAALDLCLTLRVGKIIFVGLDLAYTGGRDHADGTENQTVVRDAEIYVESVDGEKVATGKNLKVYLDWIEGRIARRTQEERKIPIIDATEGGAKKRGMEVMSLERALGGKT